MCQKLLAVAQPGDSAVGSATEDSSIVHHESACFAKITSKDASHAQEAWRPRRLFHMCLSSLCCAQGFGVATAREARHRRFSEASCTAFVADGMAWYWQIWYWRFRACTPILDCVYVVQYSYRAAQAAAGGDAIV